ncbi:adenine-specific DNA-methyltransferase [Ereboglobus sp. PH5-10]|uniref:Eco57I restriction-modification methylase domain-containing protein n=1 Tax=Ereboglobus sp. PH5-10 TaxID=2940629 RepID=UPI0024076265|nr:Eco57I restriction-modification methylase domain-containing protein [Ereboglobus sp. PH5-10]MDF9826096.1 adenine-specific DNA-methyltransferase [Ereboglobus sp. PH5-10]
MSNESASSSKQREAGVVYTRPWVVDIILDLAGYTAEKPLSELVAIEPSAGDGAFLRAMVLRLVESCKRRTVPIESANDAIRAFEIDPETASQARAMVRAILVEGGAPPVTAARLARNWIRSEDFLETALAFPIADFVIGNPPYIRLEDMPAAKAALYRSFSTMRGRADLYIAFYQAALMQLRPNGVCAYICADRWLLNDYGAALREFITTQGYAVRYIVEAHDIDAFESDVSAYPAVTVIKNAPQGPVVVAKALPGIERADRSYVLSHLTSARSNTVLQAARFNSWFHGNEPWPCASPEALALLKRLESQFRRLEDAQTGTRIGIGVATGADKIFITNPGERPDVEASRLLPLALSGDLAGGRVNWSGRHLLNPWDARGLVRLNAHPRFADYLKPHYAKLAARHTAKDKPEHWHKTIDRVNMALTGREKLYIADIKDQLLPALDEGETYPHHNLYWITSERWDLRVLGALLMSDVGRFFVHSYGVRMRGGYYRFQAQYLRRIRVPAPESISRNQSTALRRAFDTQDVALATKTAFEIYGIDKLPI